MAQNTDWYKNAVIYGLDVGRYYDSNGDGVGDFPGATAKLDYLAGLGITCIWLLPFYESPGRDNGYDVTNYLQTNQRLGTLQDARNFIEAAHARNIRVIIDLVVHHTSNEHPWFIAAATNRSSKYRDYYIWSDKRPADSPGDNIFPGEEDGVWEYEPRTSSYYHHKFYHFQPDLNIGNPEVQKEIYKVIDFWLAFGVDGFRIDAATHFFEEKGPRSALDAGRILKDMRTFVTQRNANAVLIGEADVELRQLGDYFGHGGQMHALFNFLLCNRLFSSMAQQSAAPLARHLSEERSVVGLAGTWVNFVRTLDELDLERLSEETRQKVFAAFAPKPEMQIYGRGIRRRLPPMLDGDPQRIRMVYSLLFAMPGAPMLVYGEEIGMGENLSLQGRNSVRTPMQWDDSVNSGFSTAPPDACLAPVVNDETFGYRKVNVAAQLQSTDSMLSFFRQLIALRKEQPAIGEEAYKIVDPQNPAVLALRYTTRGGRLLVVHNLSDQPQSLVLPVLARATVLFGQDCRGQTIIPFGYSWLLIQGDTE